MGFDARAAALAGQHAIEVDARHTQLRRQRADAGKPDPQFPFFGLAFSGPLPQHVHRITRYFTGVQEEISQNFTRRLERLKFSKGWTDEQLSEAVGLSRRMLYLIKTGKSALTRKTLFKLEAAERAAGLLPPESPSSVKTPSEGFHPAEKLDRAELMKAIVLIEKALDHLKKAMGEK